MSDNETTHYSSVIGKEERRNSKIKKKPQSNFIKTEAREKINDHFPVLRSQNSKSLINGRIIFFQ